MSFIFNTKTGPRTALLDGHTESMFKFPPNKLTSISIKLALVFFFIGCFPSARKPTHAKEPLNAAGDSGTPLRVVDFGSKASAARYQLNFGKLDLGKDSAKSFTIRDLPSAEFTLGIVLPRLHPFDLRQIQQQPEGKAKTIPESDLDETPEWFSDVHVALKLVNVNDGTVLIDASQTLRQWTWTNWGPRAGTSFLYCRDGATSTFKPKKGCDYRLEVSVISRSNKTQLPNPTELLMYGGGWKDDPDAQVPSSFRLLRLLGL